ncbi:MAG: prepilin-type N-terminal cleavage/methylation domain-containing protein, partial [Opitutales bacterium]
MSSHRSAFTLLEMLAVAAIITLLALAALPGAIQRLVEAQLAGEDAALESLRKDIVRSLDSSDFANLNILASSDTPGTVTPTSFTGNPDAAFTTTAAADWFAKLAAVRGSAFTASAPTQSSQPALADILFNRYSRARLLVLGPAEANQQRLLLVSLMAPAVQLVMPVNDGSAAWFNTVWNTNWDSRSAALPAAWTASLTAAQVAAWNGTSSSGSRLPRLRVVRLTVPKYTLNISNTHPTNNAYLFY